MLLLLSFGSLGDGCNFRVGLLLCFGTFLVKFKVCSAGVVDCCYCFGLGGFEEHRIGSDAEGVTPLGEGVVLHHQCHGRTWHELPSCVALQSNSSCMTSVTTTLWESRPSLVILKEFLVSRIRGPYRLGSWLHIESLVEQCVFRGVRYVVLRGCSGAILTRRQC